MIADAGPELFLFSSDYPDPDATDDPVCRFERTLTVSDEARRRFYSENFEYMMNGGAA